MQSTCLKTCDFGTQVTQLAVDLFGAHILFLRWLQYRRKIESAQWDVGVVNNNAHVCSPGACYNLSPYLMSRKAPPKINSQ
jgi:hypothetical protein